MAKTSLTQADMVLLALFEASNGSLAKVPYEEIVLLAWKKFPSSFGLRNHPEYPDSSDIHKRLYQTLVPNGHAVSLGHKVFRLTEKGLSRGSKLLGVSAAPQSGGRLSRGQELFLRHAGSTRAYQIWLADKADELVDYDARLFFQFGPTSTFNQRRQRFEAAIETLEQARRLKLERGDKLLALARYLGKRFSGLLSGDGG
jgi:hypothetical protein